MSTIKNFTEVAFTDSVKKIQEEMGSRKGYKRMEEMDMGKVFEPKEFSFIMERDSFYIASISSKDEPYVQFRGGPKGFIKLLSDTEFGFLDYGGNRQYITTGNVTEHKNVSLFLMDYVNKRRLKIWAEAKVHSVEDMKESGLYDKLVDVDYKAKIERGFTFKLRAFDWNCPKYIPQKYTIEEINSLLGLEGTKSLQEIRELISKS
ncbi:hypothetical protein A9Q84_15225 [Halobacteriovorax marinus]|uniref:Uncharacterized protein n=1 Tax=Halobacteriovorax marinus TaxID=97084 RepID=A0A1Y5F5A9_9BACT|nr:hypothetical protein A9Q84_15225 [Halobacteriovorax marinus]